MAFEEDAATRTKRFSQEVGAMEIAGDELQQSDVARESLLDAQDAATEVASLTVGYGSAVCEKLVGHCAVSEEDGGSSLSVT